MSLHSIHTYSTAIFSIYGTLHVLHHFLAATILSPEWHVEFQDKYMPRSFIGEKLFIWLPIFLSYFSGWLLIYKKKTQTKKAISETISLLVNFVFSSSNVSSSKPTVVTSSSWSDFATIRRIQYISGLLLGVCLTAHVPAVLFLRFAFKARNNAPVNIFT